MSWRILYLLVAVGFMGQAIASWMGSAPPWPNPYVWGLVALAASLTILVYAVFHRRSTLRVATATVVLASIGRAVGWMITDRAFGSKLSAASVWLIVGSIMLLVYVKAGRARLGT